MLNSHGGDLGNEDAPECIGYGRINANHIELHVELVLRLDFDPELIHPVTKIPSIVDVQ